MVTLLLVWLDLFLYTVFSVFVFYLFLFSLSSKIKRKRVAFLKVTQQNSIQRRFVVLFPAYKEDSVIVESVSNFQKQNYPSTLYDICVISDNMRDITNQQLKSLGVMVLVADFENSSKAASLNLALDNLGEDYDIAVIMDADNHVNSDFLGQINLVYESGIKAMQAHRIAKKMNSSIALLDAVSEEINNSIFRRGHVALNLSSSLSGSGMAFDFHWFKDNVRKVNSVGEDKELEVLLLLDKIHIEFLNDVPVLDEKVQSRDAFSNQRKRWIAAQYQILGRALKNLPKAVCERNLDFIDKVFQWIMPPRVILLGLTLLISGVYSIFLWQYALKWIVLLCFLIFSLWVAIPRQLKGIHLWKAMLDIPYLFLQMLISLFRVKKNSKSFIHTSHGDD